VITSRQPAGWPDATRRRSTWQPAAATATAHIVIHLKTAKCLWRSGAVHRIGIFPDLPRTKTRYHI
jgi:hypothetical protein